MRQLRNIFLLLLLSLPMWTWADGCFELTNYYSSRPTNYTTRGGDGWIATNAAVEPTSSMYFYSSYDYVMLTGGNKNTAPGQLEVRITPDKGVDTLTFLIAKPCISDRYSGAGVYVYADNELVYSQVVVAYGLSYREVQVPVNKDCQSLRIVVTNYYTNTTKEHNNRIAFAHFCWTDMEGNQPSDDPEHPEHDPEHSIQPQNHDTVEYMAQACYDQVPFVWNGIECVKTDDYYYTTTTATGKDSTTVLHFTVLPQPIYRTEQEELRVGDRMLWHNHLFAPTEAGDLIGRDTIWNTTTGCIAYIYTLNLHILPSPQEEYECKPMVTMRHDTAMCEGDSFEWFGTNISRAGKYSHTISSSHSVTCDSVCYVLNVGYKHPYIAEERMRIAQEQLPVSWNGLTCSDAGDYVFHGTTSEGCDSMVTLHLQVVEPIDNVCPEAQQVSIDSVLCPGQILVWRELITDIPGTYYDTILSRRPPFCDSVCMTLTLSYRAKSEHADTVHVCASALPYQWHGQSLTEAGAYRHTQPSVGGCDSVITLLLEVHQQDVVQEQRRVCSAQLPYVWNDIECSGAGDYTYVSTNRYGCDSTTTLHLLVDTYSSSDTMAFCYDNELPFLWHGHSLMASGTATWTTTNHVGCDSIVTLHLTVESVPVPPEPCLPTSSLTEATICKGDTYLWHGHSYSTNTTISETLTNSAGCDSVCTIRLTVRPYPVGTEMVTVCYGDSVLVQERWLKHAGVYADTLRGEGVNGCDSICRVTLRVTPRPEVRRQAVRLYAEELPYEWRGRMISEDALLTDTVTGSETGCDSVYYVLDLQVLGTCEPKPTIKKNR